MAGRFPVFKLVTLLARQLSTPIALKIKRWARSHDKGRAMCCKCGRKFHECELRFRLWTLALRQPRVVPPLSDRDALDYGATIIGEAIMFLIGGLIVTCEVNRQANNKEDKKLEKKSQWLAVLLSLEELQREVQLQQQDIDRLHAALRSLAPDYHPALQTPPTSMPSVDKHPFSPLPKELPPRPPTEKDIEDLLPISGTKDPEEDSEDLPLCSETNEPNELHPRPPIEDLLPSSETEKPEEFSLCPSTEEPEELPPCPPTEELPPCL